MVTRQWFWTVTAKSDTIVFAELQETEHKFYFHNKPILLLSICAAVYIRRKVAYTSARATA